MSIQTKCEPGCTCKRHTAKGADQGLCIGWEAVDGCPHFGGSFHGCVLPASHEPRSTPHRCECGARHYGNGPQSVTKVDWTEPIHGTVAGAKRHWRHGEPICPECADAAALVAQHTRPSRTRQRLRA